MKFSVNKDINHAVKELMKSGWKPHKKGKHWQIKAPDGTIFTVPSSPSDGRAFLNFKGDIRRAGWGRG